jgi:hypothetical protein
MLAPDSVGCELLADSVGCELLADSVGCELLADSVALRFHSAKRAFSPHHTLRTCKMIHFCGIKYAISV